MNRWQQQCRRANNGHTAAPTEQIPTRCIRTHGHGIMVDHDLMLTEQFILLIILYINGAPHFLLCSAVTQWTPPLTLRTVCRTCVFRPCTVREKAKKICNLTPPHPPFFFLFFLFLGTVDQTKLLTTLPSARSQYKYGSRSTPTRSSPPKMQKQQPSSSSSSKSPQRIVRRQVVHV